MMKMFLLNAQQAAMNSVEVDHKSLLQKCKKGFCGYIQNQRLTLSTISVFLAPNLR